MRTKTLFNYLLLLFIALDLTSQVTHGITTLDNIKVKIQWTQKLEDDFSFNNKWSYPEGVYRNKWGQLSCDGFCPEEAYKLMTDSGKVYEDSLESFYNIIDTSHLHYSLSSKTNSIGYSNSDFISFRIDSEEKILGASQTNASGYSRLFIELSEDSCTAWIEYRSIYNTDIELFRLVKGSIKIDQSSYERGIIRGVFDFVFTENYYWEGKIYSAIL